MGSAEPPAQALRPRVDQIDNVPALNAGRKRKKIDAMQVTETLAEGLKHEFQISVSASDLDAKADAKLVDLKDKVRLNGFRPGEMPVAEVSDADIDEAIKRIADQNRAFAAKAEGAKAETGDRVTISFKGSIDGTPFDGGTGE